MVTSNVANIAKIGFLLQTVLKSADNFSILSFFVKSKFMWSSKSNKISYRYNVASKQIEFYFWQVGLRIIKPKKSNHFNFYAQSIAFFKPCSSIFSFFPGYIE